MNTGLVQSVQARLIRHANGFGLDPNLVLARYGMERLLYRLSRSPHVKSRLPTAQRPVHTPVPATQPRVMCETCTPAAWRHQTATTAGADSTSESA